MRLCTNSETLMRIGAVVFAVVGAAAIASAQVSVVPSSLAFGVPGSTTGVTSAAQPVVLSVTSGSATVSSVTITPTNENTGKTDFAVQSNTCIGTQTAPAACTISVTFTPSQPAPTLESATLTVNVTEGDPFAVNLTGALGAIQLFTPVNVANSTPQAATQNVTFGNQPLNLSCPVSGSVPTGTLSSTPDGSGYVVVDNYLEVAVNNGAATNVCTSAMGSAPGTNSCFSSNYENNAEALLGTDPDTFATPGNTNPVLEGQPGGVQPINISSDLSSIGSTAVPVTFSLVDAQQASGNFYTSSTIFLVTNCTSNGVAPGGTISGNPVSPSNPASLVQTFPFSNTPGKLILFDFNFTLGQGLMNTGSPQNTDVGFSQSTFATMVQGTSAGPALCLHMSGELGPPPGNAPLCKAYVFVCPDANGNLAGANCAQSTARTLLFETKFDTTDALNFAPGTGPGFLMGSDNWVANSPNGPVVTVPCVFPSPGQFAGQLCPQNPLTGFYGADDPRPQSSSNPNSTFVAVINMPLPFTLPLVPPWQNQTTVNLLFSSFPAVYIPTPQRPANGFKPAAIQSITFGLTSTAVPVPSPTFPISTDTTLFNGGASACPTPKNSIFVTSATIQNVTEGRYNLHYFATDCASTEELNFTPNNNPSIDWASFKTVPLNVDLTAPSISLLSGPTITTSRGVTKVTVSYQCTDPNLSDGTPGSGVVVCGTYVISPTSSTGTLQTVFTVSGSGNKSLTAVDLAGNVSTPLVVPY